MTWVEALTVGCLFGTGTALMARRRLASLAVGILLATNAAILSLVVCGLGGRGIPVAPYPPNTADPLVQAMALTAVVIGCATAVFLFKLIAAALKSRDPARFHGTSPRQATPSREQG